MNKTLLETIVARLELAYGRQSRYSRKNPMEQLIATILSQRTNYADEMLAYNTLRERFPSWEAVAAAPVAEVEAAIFATRYPDVKAPRIQEVIRRVLADSGDTELDFLQTMDTESAQAYLMSLPGVGYKTSSFVLLFSMQRPVLPVDTHVHRVSTRTGILAPKTSLEKAHVQLLHMLPKEPDELLNFHKLLFKHGQETCTFSFPQCRRCPLNDICAYYQQGLAGKTTGRVSGQPGGGAAPAV